MPRFQRREAKEQLSAGELREFRAKLDALPGQSLVIQYKAALNACRYDLRLPSPRLVQEFVQTWKALRKRRQ